MLLSINSSCIKKKRQVKSGYLYTYEKKYIFLTNSSRYHYGEEQKKCLGAGAVANFCEDDTVKSIV